VTLKEEYKLKKFQSVNKGIYKGQSCEVTLIGTVWFVCKL